MIHHILSSILVRIQLVVLSYIYMTRDGHDTCIHEGSSCNVMFLQKKIVSEYDQEIHVPQSQTADNPVAPRGRAAQPSRDTRKTN